MFRASCEITDRKVFVNVSYFSVNSVCLCSYQETAGWPLQAQEIRLSGPGPESM